MSRKKLLPRLITILLIGQLFLGNVTRTHAFLQTLGDFLSLGANTVREIQEAIQLASGETRALLESLESTLNELLAEIEETYQDNLSITIDSIDNATRNKLLEMESLLVSVNGILQEDVRFLSAEAQNLLQQASLRIRQVSADLKSDLQDVVLVAGETGGFLISRATENIIVIASVILLAIGILIFVGIFFRGHKATGATAVLAFGLVGIYILFFGALILIPGFRAWVISSTGIGLQERVETITLQPNVLAVLPEEIIVGETGEVDIWGRSLLPNGEQPTVTLANVAIPFTAADDRFVLNVGDVTAANTTTSSVVNTTSSRPVLQFDREFTRTLLLTPIAPIPQPGRPDLATIDRLSQPHILVDRALIIEMNLETLIPLDSTVSDLIPVDPSVLNSITLPEGASVLKLDYQNFNDITTILRITVPEAPAAPPDLVITGFTISPSTVVEDDNASASITIQNTGGQPATNFNVVWRATPTSTAETQNVTNLDPGASQTFVFNSPYRDVGTFTSVAEVDTLNRVTESSEGNNSRTTSVTVNVRPPRTVTATVTFTGVTVHDDADPFASGELILTFNVNGQTGRFPNSGTRSVSGGDTVNFTRTFEVTLQENQSLNVFVNGIDEDEPSIGDANDQMGSVNRSYSSGSTWGSGSHQERSTCPDGCYTIFYTIDVSQ